MSRVQEAFDTVHHKTLCCRKDRIQKTADICTNTDKQLTGGLYKDVTGGRKGRGTFSVKYLKRNYRAYFV